MRNKNAKRDVDLPKELITEDAESVILGSDIVIELAGGIEPAKTCIKMALNAGADVFTANKALIAAHGSELPALAQQFGAQLYYEAAVGGAIPIIRPLRASLAGDKINRVMGIVNGTDPSDTIMIQVLSPTNSANTPYTSAGSALICNNCTKPYRT